MFQKRYYALARQRKNLRRAIAGTPPPKDVAGRTDNVTHYVFVGLDDFLARQCSRANDLDTTLNWPSRCFADLRQRPRRITLCQKTNAIVASN
jgi:hypothetical protein